MWIGECGQDHADRIVPMGWCDQKGEKGSNYLFYCLFQTTYLYGNGIMQMGGCKWKHVDLSVWIGGCGWERANGSVQMVAWGWEYGDGTIRMGAWG